jgi:ABC-type Fe3+-siderophore transport system permease subunit
MSEENSAYDWNAISKGAVLGAIGVVLAFSNLVSNWRWGIAAICMAAAYGIVSFSSKKKSDLFSAVALVFVAALIMHFLSKAGFV